jgi:hypothetical protein
MKKLFLRGFPVIITKRSEVIERITVIDLAEFARAMIERRKEDPTLGYKVKP